MRQLSELVLALKRRSVNQIEVAAELMLLLDQLDEPVDYNNIADKQVRLEKYFETCQTTLSGEKTQITIQELSKDLHLKASWLSQHIRSQEWIHSAAGYSWFNGYYDNNSQRVEGDHPKGVRMTLTGQVFPLMGEVATDDQVQEMIRAADKYLLDPQVGGYRLNTNFSEVLLDLGRAFGFAFGHKENGAMFSHMAVMYANALYQRGFVQEGFRVLNGIYQHSMNYPVSRMYPGIPEYFNNRGRGMYPYLTGSASWYLLTMVTEVFGVQGRLGDLDLSPKLVNGQFDQQGRVSIRTMFAGRKIEITIQNPDRIDYGEYQIGTIKLAGEPIPFKPANYGAIVARQAIEQLSTDEIHSIEVILVRRD